MAIDDRNPREMSLEEILAEINGIASRIFQQLRDFSIQGGVLTLSTGFAFGLGESQKFDTGTMRGNWEEALVWARSRGNLELRGRRVWKNLFNVFGFNKSDNATFEQLLNAIAVFDSELEKPILMKFWEDNTMSVVTVHVLDLEKDFRRSSGEIVSATREAFNWTKGVVFDHLGLCNCPDKAKSGFCKKCGRKV